MEVTLTVPSTDFVQAAVSVEYDLSSPEMNYVNLEISYGTVHYKYGQNFNFELLSSSINVNIQTPWEGYNNITSSMEYDFTDFEKFINILFDNGKEIYIDHFNVNT